MKMPKMVPVRSSNIQSLGHDGKNLVVRFNGGTLYRYAGVPTDVYQAGLEVAEEGGSVGSWFSGAIRGRYNHVQIDPE